MKTKVEINGYEIEIEEKNGLISVSATFEGEVVEEFQIETEEGQDEEGQEEVQGFDEFGQDEEEDFGQDDEEGQEDDEEGQEEDEDESQDEFEGKLESFQSFINKKK
jgi:hypothetical protein